MAKIKDVASIWNNIREIDLRPIRESAKYPLSIALLGAPGSGRHTLATCMRVDPLHPHLETHTPVLISGLELTADVAEADLIIVILDSRADQFNREQELARTLTQAGKRALVFVNLFDLTPEQKQSHKTLALQGWSDGKIARLATGSARNAASLFRQFVPAVIDLLPEQLLSLGRQFPLFHVPIAHKLIQETCFSNAAYALSTGLAEIVPVFNIPLNVTDMIVLTKAQAFLVYKLGLSFGFSTRWQDYVAEFGSVIGGGFMWRQLARFLVGLIPAWGIIPKVAIAYSGTYVVGNVVLRWYLTGRHLTRAQMRQLSTQAFARGKNLARKLLEQAPRPRLSRRKKTEPQLLPTPAAPRECPQCKKSSAADAIFCQYCGYQFDSNTPIGEPDISAGEQRGPD